MKDIRPLPTRKTCRDCQVEQPVSAFGTSRSKDSPHGFYYRSYCIECGKIRSQLYGTAHRGSRNARLREWRQKSPKKVRQLDLRKRLWSKYKMTPLELEELTEAQKGQCLLCHQRKRLFIDHDHNTGRVRGLLCPRCNSILGHLEQHPGLLKSMAAYLSQPCHADVLLEIANQ